MTNDLKALKEMKWRESEIGIAKREEKMKAKGSDKIVTENCVLNNVFFVPDLSRNLLSVSAIVQNGGEMIFTKHGGEIKKDGKIFMAKQTKQGLWMVNLGENESQTAVIAKETGTVYEWHRKLGHLGAKNMKRLLNLAERMNIVAEEIEEAVRDCKICIKSKQVRVPFGKERSRATRPLEIIHTVCGPIEPSTWDNKRYMLTFLDDYTHFAVIYLLDGK